MSRPNSRKATFIQTRDEYGNIFKEAEKFIKFNYKYFSYGENSGQSFEEWQNEGILAELNEKLKEVSGSSKIELIQNGVLELYTNGYPYNSTFEKPKALASLDIMWARIRLTGRRRLIGFFLPQCAFEDENKAIKHTDTNVFYVVFLDKEHQFAPYKKRNT